MLPQELTSNVAHFTSLLFRRTATICEIATPEIYQIVVHPLYRQLLVTTATLKGVLAENEKLRQNHARLLQELGKSRQV